MKKILTHNQKRAIAKKRKLARAIAEQHQRKPKSGSIVSAIGKILALVTLSFLFLASFYFLFI